MTIVKDYIIISTDLIVSSGRQTNHKTFLEQKGNRR